MQIVLGTFIMKNSSSLTPIFLALLMSEKLPVPQTEYKFLPDRKFRFDYAWLDHRVFLEVEGGVWIGGGHTSGSGFTKNIEKYNLAASKGWRMLRVVPKDLLKTATIQLIRETLNHENNL